MNSTEWRNYPKPGAQFPRVGECPDCHGTGLRITPHAHGNYAQKSPYSSTYDSNFYIECPRCQGYGKTIPEEWLAG